MTATTTTVAPTMRLVPPAAEPARLGSLELLRWSVDQMEAEAMRRRRRTVPVQHAREVLADLQNVAALVGLYLPLQHPTQQVVDLIVDAIDHELGRDPHRDYTPQHRRRVARIAAAMAKGGA